MGEREFIMKILITGASGFIGRNILLTLRGKGHEIVALYNRSGSDFEEFVKRELDGLVISIYCLDLSNIEDVRSCEELFEEIDLCLFLCANGDPGESIIHPNWDLDCNTKTLVNLLSIASFDKFIFVSSGAVYEGLLGLVDIDSKLNPELPYAISKLASEQYVKFFYKQERIKNYLILRLFGTYGPYEPSRKLFSRFIGNIIIGDYKEFEVKGDGTNLLDYIYIEDLVQAFIKVIESKEEVWNRIYNVCMGKSTPIYKLLSIAMDYFKRNVKLIYNGEATEPIKFFADPQLFKKTFDIEYRTWFTRGVDKLEEWIRC